MIKERDFTMFAVVLLGIILIMSLSLIMVAKPSADELVFIRLTDNLPNYYTHAEWWSIDGVTHPSDIDGASDRALIDLHFETEFWHHPPVASFLAWPFVKPLNFNSLDDDETLQATSRLRIIVSVILGIVIIGIAWIASRLNCTDDKWLKLLPLVPLIFALPFFIFPGNNWFYPSTLMLFFLAIALVLRETRYKKFVLIPLVLMVGCTIEAFIFLIQFALEKKKLALCSLALVPYLTWSYVVSGSWLTPFAYFGAVSGVTTMPFSWVITVLPQKYLGLANFGAPVIIAMLVPLGYLIHHYVKENKFYITLAIIMLTVCLGWAWNYYHLIGIALIAPIIIALALKTRETRKATSVKEVRIEAI